MVGCGGSDSRYINRGFFQGLSAEGGQSGEGGGTADASCGTMGKNCTDMCKGSFESHACQDGDVLTGFFHNVEASEGTCDLSNALLTGNLIAKEGAKVKVGSSVLVCGDLLADESEDISLMPGTSYAGVCGNLHASEVETINLVGAVSVVKNAHFDETSEAVYVEGANMCADVVLQENSRVTISGTATTTVMGACAASENGEVDFSGLKVNGDNVGCLVE